MKLGQRLLRRLKEQPVAFWALLVFIFTIPWEDAIVLPGVGTLSRLIGIGAFGLAALSALRSRAGLRAPSTAILLVFAYICWLVLQYFWSPSAEVAANRLVTMVQLLAMVWLIYDLCDTAERRRLAMVAYLVGAVVLIGIALWTYSLAGGIDRRLAPENFNPNAVAICLAISIPMAVYLGLRVKTWYFALLPFAWWVLLLTGSRGGWAAGAVATVLSLVANRAWSARRQLAVGALVGLGVWAALAQAPDALLERGYSAPTEIAEGEFSGRGGFWYAGALQWAERPLVGHGLASSRELIGEITGTRPRSAHNTWLTILIQHGLVGAVLLGGAFAVALVDSRRLPDLERRILLALTLSLLTGSIVRDLDHDKPLWFVLAVLIAFTASAAQRRRGLSHHRGQPVAG